MFWVLGHEARGDLSFPIRDRICTLCTGRWNPNHWTTSEVPRTKTWCQWHKPTSVQSSYINQLLQRQCHQHGFSLLYLLLLLSCFSRVQPAQPHRRQPTRLCRPWDSPGKNTGMGCHFLLQCMKVKSESEVAQSCPTCSNPIDCSLWGSSVHGIFQARVLEWAANCLLCFFTQKYLEL